MRTDGPLGLYRGEPSPNPNPNPDPNLNPSPHPNQARYSHCCATRPRRACTFCCTRRVTRTPTLTLTLTLTLALALTLTLTLTVTLTLTLGGEDDLDDFVAGSDEDEVNVAGWQG